MNNWQSMGLYTIGIVCLPLSVLILRVLFSAIFAHRRWHRTGLWLFAVGYASLGLGILGQLIGFTDTLWIYVLADGSLVMAPCVIIASYALEHRQGEGA